jgi:hypothetical protein
MDLETNIFSSYPGQAGKHSCFASNFDKLLKSPKFGHAPAFAGAGSAKAGIQNYLKTLDSRLRGNDVKGRFRTFYVAIIFIY